MSNVATANLPAQQLSSTTATNEYVWENSELKDSSSYILPFVWPEVRKLQPGATVVDVGCGNGSVVAQFRGRGLDLHGLEISSAGLREARKAFPEVSFEQADLTGDLSSHPLAGTADLVISTEVVEHVFLPRLFAANCHALLRPGGRLVISTPYHGYLKNLMLAGTGMLETHFTALWDFGHIKFWSRKTLTALLEEAGFSVEKFHGAGRVPYIWKSMVLVASRQG